MASGLGTHLVWICAVLVACGCAPSAPAKPNILFLLVDSLRADHLGFAGYHRETSPCLDSLAARGAAFTTCIAQAPYTIASVPSLLTGLYPTSACYTAPVRIKGRDTSVTTYRLGKGVRSVAAILGDHGYRSGAFVANGDMAVRQFGLADQFDHVDADHLCDSGDCAERLNRRVLDWLRDVREQPWLCYVHYMDVHYPYDAPPRWSSRFSASYGKLPAPGIRWMRRHGRNSSPDREEMAHIVGMYDAEIAYLDNQICRLLAGLRGLGLSEDLLVVVASDHGDEFHEHEGFGHTRTLHEELIRCPLILAWRGRVPAGIRITSPVQNVDVVPTVLDLLRIALPAEMQGASLRPFFDGEAVPRPVFSEKQGTSVRRGEWKLWEDAEGNARLYHLGTDPAERVNRAGTEPDTLRLLQGVLERWRSSLPPPARHAVELEVESLDPDQVYMLKQLGYLE